MRQRSETWVRLARGDFRLETKAWIGDKVYKQITAPKINRSLMSSPLSVGNCISATLGLSILTDDVLDAKVPIIIKGRLTDGQTVTEWLPFGTFYINQKSSFKGLWTVSCYDAMLKANQSYLSADDDGTGWPKTMADVVAEVAYRIGVSVDPRTQIQTGDGYTVPLPTGLTMMQVLGYIGGCHGGNWIITEDNALRLVPLVNAPADVALAAQTSGQITPESVIPNTHYITDDGGRPIVTMDGFYLVWAEDGYVSAVDGLATVDAVLGSLDIGTSVTVSGVTMSDNSGKVFTAGAAAGAGVINIDSNPYATQGMCDELYAKFAGYVYAPYTASKAIYDPAAELGDQVVIGDQVSSVLYSTNLHMDTGFMSDISAPNSEELSAEYPYLTEFRKLAQTTAALNESIKKTAEELTETVENSSTDVAALSKTLSEEIARSSGVELELNTRIGNEETRAKAAEASLQTDIDNEETRAKAAEKALQEAINAATGTGGELANRVGALEQKDATHDTDISNLKAKAESHDTDIAGIKAKAESYDADFAGLKAKDESHDTDIAALKTKAESHDTDIAGLKQKDAGHDTEIAGLKDKDGTHDTAIAGLQQTVSDQAILIAALQERLTQDEAAIADLTARLAALEGTE